MTTLAAIQGDGWVVMGCDSRSSDEDGRPMQMATHKIVENNGILIAGAGAGRGSNIMQFGWKAPKPTASQDLDVFMTQTFIPAMRQTFIDAGYDMKEMAMLLRTIRSFLSVFVELFILFLRITLGTVIHVVSTTLALVAQLLLELWQHLVSTMYKMHHKLKG